MLTILFSSLVSLSMGSLLGLLGAVLRWPLLARRAHAPRDADLILGMPNPTGSLKLIVHHCGRSGNWSVTTWIVLAYLLVNIIGRLSVATFGLTYDLNENAKVDYPVMLHDFGIRDWMQLDTSDLNLGKYCPDHPGGGAGGWHLPVRKNKNGADRNFFDGSVYEKGARVGTLGKPAVLFFGQVLP
jgi:hypothetical protein